MGMEPRYEGGVGRGFVAVLDVSGPAARDQAMHGFSMRWKKAKPTANTTAPHAEVIDR